MGGTGNLVVRTDGTGARQALADLVMARALIGWHGILARIISIQLDRGVGYRLDSGMAVLNAIRQSKSVQRSQALESNS